jgi:hypothetical protein
MKINYNWKSNLVSNTYNLFRDGREIGQLRINTCSRIAKSIVNGKDYNFKTKGTLHQYTEIIDCIDNKLTGVIQYNSWASKAEISVNNTVLNWKFNNTWNSEWSLFNADNIINYTLDASTKGQIESNTEDTLLLICGLFIKNHFWQRAVTSLMVVLLTCLIVFL